MMNRLKIIGFYLLVLILILVISACTGQTGELSPISTGTSPDEVIVVETEESLELTTSVNTDNEPTQIDPDTGNPTAEVQHKSTETLLVPTPTMDTRLPPDEWRSWPVVPTLSPVMIELYQQGLELGNRQGAFSKVGDCQNIPEVFLGLYDNPGGYSLPDRLSQLEETIDHFSGSFGREGMALKGGFVFPTVFSPLRADSSVCDPGETPYECELRVHQPSFVLISMEFRYEGRTAETHEKYLRKAIEYALSRGIVPILATKADNFEGDHSLNRTTAEIAYEYDVPLWNGWLAVQILNDHGIDWERDSYGFHITPDAWLVRSQTFLQALDSVWRDARLGVESGEDN